MRKNAVIAIGFVAFAVLAALFLRTPGSAMEQLQVQRAEELRESERLYQEARKTSCRIIGRELSDCMEGNAEACTRLGAEEQEFVVEYGGADAVTECRFNQPAPTPEASGEAMDKTIPGDVAPPAYGEAEAVQQPETIPTREENPLFFGDEEGQG